MKTIIKDKNTTYEINVEQFTQLCGTNFKVKNYILDSISKHYSSEKYAEYEEYMINNILIDNEESGRRAFNCIRLSSRTDLLNQIQLTKTGMAIKLIKESITDFECQNELTQIDNLLMNIFSKLNSELLPLSDIEISYAINDIFSIIQQSSFKTTSGEDIHELSNEQLIKNYLELLELSQKKTPDKSIIIFENIDHLLSQDDYIKISEQCISLTYYANIYFIMTTSIDNYVYLDEEHIKGINIINDEIFTCPELSRLFTFVKDNYPIAIDWSEQSIIISLLKIIHRIGKYNCISEIADLIILKLINSSISINNYVERKPTNPELECLLDKNMI